MDKTLLQFKIEATKRKAKSAIGKGMEISKAGLEYVSENKEVIIPVAMGGMAIAKKMANSHKVKAEEKDRLTRFYDCRNGRYTYTKRIPKGREEAEIERRYKSGESYRSILTDMGLAK